MSEDISDKDPVAVKRLLDEISIAESFKDIDALDDWLSKNHGTQQELWVQIFKKGSGVSSVDWNDCVIAALTWGWIDGKKRSYDHVSYLQRLTPRRPNSVWSKRNRHLAECLVEKKKMQPSGLAQIEAAKGNGQWQNAYSGSATMEMPDDFMVALGNAPAAHTQFKALSRAKKFEIYQAITTVRRSDTKARRIASIIKDLSSHNSQGA